MNSQNDQTKPVEQAAAAPLPFEHTGDVQHIPCDGFEVNIVGGMVKLSLGCVMPDQKSVKVMAVAHIPAPMMEPLINAMGMVANAMGIKLHNSIQ